MTPYSSFIVGALVFQVAAAPSPPAGIARVAWLKGCWESVNGPRVVEEQWTAPLGRSMLGMGRTLAGERLIEYELIVLREEGNELVYEAHPSGQPPTVFISRTIGGRQIVFENLDHDFPQRVGYERGRADELLAWIEGDQHGQSRRVEFSYHRAACPGR
jgi:hypothetical protein